MRLSSTLQQGHSPTALVHQKWWDMDQLLDFGWFFRKPRFFPWVPEDVQPILGL
jgi:hypothetical protein